MSRKYKFHKPEGIYFVSFATVNWIDVFSRRLYKDILVESINYCLSPVRRSVKFDNLGVRHSVSLCRSYTDCTNNIAQFRQSLIVLFVCPAMRDVPYAFRNTQSALTTVHIK